MATRVRLEWLFWKLSTGVAAVEQRGDGGSSCGGGVYPKCARLWFRKGMSGGIKFGVCRTSKTYNAYCFPRGKLLDIYRKLKTATYFDILSDEMDHLLPITQKETVEPLAFVPPDAEEEAVLGDIWKGKATSSGVLYNSYRDTNVAEVISGEGKQSSLVNREDAETCDRFTGNCDEGSKGGLRRVSPSDIDVTQFKLLQEQQHLHLQMPHSQSLQFLLDQLLQHQMSGPGYSQHVFDAARDNRLDQVQLRRHILSESQQNSHASSHLDSSLEQIIQEKINQGALQGQQDEFFDLMSQAKYGNMLPSEHQLRLQQEQFQVQQLSMALRQQLGMEGDRRLAGSLSADEVRQFVGNPSNPHQAHSVGLNASDNYQQRLSPLEDPYFNRQNHSLQDLPERGNFDPNSTAFGRLNLPAVAPGMKVENANSMDLAENLYRQSKNQLGPFSSGNHSLGQHVPCNAYASHPGATESFDSRKNVRLENSWTIKQMQHLNLETELQRRKSEVDSSTWASAGGVHENSKKALMDLLQQKLGLQNSDSSALLQDHLHGVAVSGYVNQMVNCERFPLKAGVVTGFR
ncbi:Ribosomal protein L7Ae/L30e/S12e/Gadd45 family protein [Hibiscus syriacus]|uniref:Ribosomal protein L7Ae/L30e/S12e/Gadd45 family protein n=1 Tax=Hibiscus syriacus TaxID=106335 RepID=A0A6A2XRH1_HIBSY|nr:Ribosomal protein L7Ae/L30e/S12e/Gadd45 family protein [Hibiscus syriacus]